jgi:hypothetical protein
VCGGDRRKTLPPEKKLTTVTDSGEGARFLFGQTKELNRRLLGEKRIARGIAQRGNTMLNGKGQAKDASDDKLQTKSTHGLDGIVVDRPQQR